MVPMTHMYHYFVCAICKTTLNPKQQSPYNILADVLLSNTLNIEIPQGCICMKTKPKYWDVEKKTIFTIDMT